MIHYVLIENIGFLKKYMMILNVFVTKEHNMRAEEQDLLEVMFDNKRQYQIPVYQRNYDWKKANCEMLFNDVIMAYQESKSHFLGSVVQVQQDEEDNIKKFIIIDGQQRMTSIYLLLKALYDSDPMESDKELIESYLFNIKNNNILARDNKLKLKLKPIKTDNIQFVYLMDNKLEDMDISSNIYLNYDYFKSLIKRANYQGITIRNILYGLKKLVIVMISLKEPNDDPQIVFERINSTGEDLSLADLIRNYILMTDQNMDDLYENYWLPIETKIGKERLVDFFKTYLIYKLPDNNKDQYQSFKNYINKNEISHLQLLVEMKKLSKYYSAFVAYSSDYSERINNLLDGFRCLKQTTIFSFLFSIFDDYENETIDEEALYSTLLFFLNYTIRRAVTGVPTNSLRGLYKGLYKRIFNSADKKISYLHSIYSFMADIQSKDAVPNDTIFKDKLLTADIYQNRDSCRFLLKILENGINSLKETVNINNDVTIEHLMPQNRDNEDWHKEIGENFYYVWDKYIHTLGNLTLTGYNSELSDRPFKEKRDMIKSKSKFVFLNCDIIDKKHWNEESIRARAERLSSKLLAELKLPEEFKKVKKDDLNGRHSLDENVDFTSKKVKSFILLGESREVKSATDMLVSVCEFLNEIEPEKMLSFAKQNFVPENSRSYLFSLNQNLLRDGKEISNSGIYVETNRSFNDIVRIIKKLIDIFGLDYDDFVFYTN